MVVKVQEEQDAFWAENLNAAEKGTLSSFRKTLEDSGLLLDKNAHDIELCRFLKARKWDSAKALQMWQDNLQWRASFFAAPMQPPLTDSETQAIRLLYPHFFHKTDRFGRPVYYELIGELKIAELLQVSTVQRLMSIHCHSWERTKALVFPACSIAANRHIYNCVTVLDMKGFKMTTFNKEAREFIAAVAGTDQARYPEHLGQMFIVNAPMMFKAIWQVITPWLEPRTQAKIQVISSEKQAREALSATIPPQNLLSRFGGTSEVDLMNIAGVGPWSDPAITDEIVRSKWQYRDSMTDSNVSTDTSVGAS